MNIKKTITLALLTALSACSQMVETDTPEIVIHQLTGTWLSTNHDGKVIFYADKTAKMLFPKHQPPIKLISSYSTIKDYQIGINLRGSWSGPAFINTANLQQQQISITFPDEQPILLNKTKP